MSIAREFHTVGVVQWKARPAKWVLVAGLYINVAAEEWIWHADSKGQI